MRPPETKYAKSGDVHIAYQVLGQGPIDLVVVPGFVSHLELAREMPFTRGSRRAENFARVIRFDRRGTGLSDRSVGVATLEQRMDDVRAVMDAVGVERAVRLPDADAGPAVCSTNADVRSGLRGGEEVRAQRGEPQRDGGHPQDGRRHRRARRLTDDQRSHPRHTQCR